MAMTLPEVIMQDVTLPLANDRSLFGCKLNDSTNMHHLTQIVRYIPSGLVAAQTDPANIDGIGAESLNTMVPSNGAPPLLGSGTEVSPAGSY
ncbi:Hypothetical predicted protein [Octopus vulgaris]|uniref:Uncharacterized protein n=1 Tax=Octopus vulgaris TaxID=6645 RepID=A0AA36FB25_OCTVU|nr:Hypothetical predicted protein [Octopus vulgaris]